MRQWHVVMTKPRQEHVALDNLQRQGFDAWLPLARESRALGARGSARVVPLFPRYLFVHVDPASQNIAPIRSTLGCCGVLRFGLQLAVMPEAAVSTLRQRCDDHGCIPLPVDELPQCGQVVRVVEGPFAGFNAVFQAENGQDRVVVLLEWLGVARAVQLPASAIEAALV